MTKKKKYIYVVTSGDHSNYTIETIFEDIAHAEVYVQTFEDTNTSMKIERYPLNYGLPPFIKIGHKFYSVTISSGGNILDISVETSPTVASIQLDKATVFRNKRTGALVMDTVVAAEDEYHAKEKALGRWSFLIANRLFTEGSEEEFKD